MLPKKMRVGVIAAIVVAAALIGWALLAGKKTVPVPDERPPARLAESAGTTTEATTESVALHTDDDEIIQEVLKEMEWEAARTIDKAFSELKYKLDPREFVKREWLYGLPYTQARDLFKADSLPTLYAALGDPEYASHWPRIAELISFISDDQKPVSVIVAYVRRSDDWTLLNPKARSDSCVGKVKSLQWVGLIGGEQADSVLTRAITPDGARELVKEWIDGPLPIWAAKKEGDLLDMIRSYAALGAVYSQNKESMQLVEDLYETVRAESMKKGTFAELDKKLVFAMAARDLIGIIGMEEYRNLLGTEALYDALRPYMTKRGRYILSVEYPNHPWRSWGR